MSKIQLMDIVSENSHNIHQVASSLRSYAHGFSVTGNHILALELLGKADVLDTSRTAISTAVYLEKSRQANEGQTVTSTLIEN